MTKVKDVIDETTDLLWTAIQRPHPPATREELRAIVQYGVEQLVTSAPHPDTPEHECGTRPPTHIRGSWVDRFRLPGRNKP